MRQLATYSKRSELCKISLIFEEFDEIKGHIETPDFRLELENVEISSETFFFFNLSISLHMIL